MNRLLAECLAVLDAASTDAERAACAHWLASFYRDVGDLAECENYARAAVDWVGRTDSVVLLGNHLMFLALLLRIAPAVPPSSRAGVRLRRKR